MPRRPSSRPWSASRPPTAAPDTEALGATEFAALLDRLGPFERRPALAVACSGGPDSLALTLLAAEWAQQRGGTLTALIVDHGLRDASAEEARQAAAWLGERGIDALLLRWCGPKPATGIQEAARRARYDLLTAACESLATVHLLVAHHADDQAETVMMRLARTSGPAGLAAIAPIRELAVCRLLRPLLTVPKARLLAALRERGQPWHDDPSNRSGRFLRAVLRGAGGLDRPALCMMAARAAAERTCEERAIATLLARAARPGALGHVLLDRAALEHADPEESVAALGYVVRSVGGRRYPIPLTQLRHLAAAMLVERNKTRRSLGGCLVQWSSESVCVSREPGRIREVLPLDGFDRRLWDGRFEVRCGELPSGLTLRALGAIGRRALPLASRRRLKVAKVPATVIESLPAVFADRVVGCPPLGWWAAGPLPVAATIRPLQPLAPAPHSSIDVV